MKRDISRTCHKHHGFSKRLKLAFIERFGKNVSQLAVNGYKRKRYYPGFHKITDEVMFDVYVLGTRMLNQILENIDGTCVVTVDGHGV
jgi:hypothetical protein